MKDPQPPPPKKTRIDDFFKKSEKPDKEKDEENQEQSTSSDVQEPKCPKRKVLLDDDDETDDSKKKRAVRKRSSAVMQDLGKTQMVLDCGQAVIGMTTCEECGMVYSVDVAGDVKSHNKFHEEWKYRFEIPKHFSLQILRFDFRDMNDYRVYYLGTFAEDNFKNLIVNHMKEVNKILGYTDEKDDLWTLDKRMFLIVWTKDERILIGGILVAEKVTKAYTSVTRKEIVAEDDVNDWIVGVDRIWVDPTMRKKGVATTLLDAATSQNRMMDFRPRRLRVAFSDPTDEGLQLAKRFIETRYLVVDQFDGEALVY